VFGSYEGGEVPVKIMTAILLMLVALDLSGCGKRARFLDPPEGTTEKHPAHYPPPDSSGSHL
jgi:hypothetical protein